MRLAIAAVVLAVANAHAEPPRLELRHDIAPQRLRIEHTPRHDHGIDEALAIALMRVTQVAGKLSQHGFIPYLHVDNLVSTTHESAPRTVVIGLQLGPITASR